MWPFRRPSQRCYEVDVYCKNCTANVTVRIPRGTHRDDATPECPRCGVVGKIAVKE